MCGIAGIMTLDGSAPDAAVLDALDTALAHRGPDGRGRHLSGGVGLVQRRLAIIDLETGDQPLYAALPTGGRAALVANGEIYNYLELRAEIGEENFVTRSDCEPPLHLYARRGVGFAESLRGMYAIALHDPDAGRLVLARDPFGIKPLYYLEASWGLAFASEPQALIAAGLTGPALRAERCRELLQLQFTTGAETIFAGIQRVLPGETLIVEAGRVVERRHRPALPDQRPESAAAAAALHDLDEVLTESVGFHQRSDVPYAMFFSGGIDSSALLALMARLNAQPVRTYTAGFPETGVHDERGHARAVAKAVRAEAVDVAVTEADFWALLPEIAAAMDDPAADYAILPTYMLARAVRADGLKVVLAGEGGDEMFAGYGRYRTAIRSWPWRRPMRRKGALYGLDVFREKMPDGVWRRGIVAAERDADGRGLTRLQIVQRVDCTDWLPNDLLTKLDRCLMAHGVEGRVPFLDPQVGAFAFTLPDHLKVRRRMGKWLLRKWLETGLPSAKPFSRKRGFTVPVGEWIAARGARLGPLVAAQPGIEELCGRAAVERLFATGARRHPTAVWNLLFYALWHHRHVMGRAPAGDVFETLAAR